MKKNGWAKACVRNRRRRSVDVLYRLSWHCSGDVPQLTLQCGRLIPSQLYCSEDVSFRFSWHWSLDVLFRLSLHCSVDVLFYLSWYCSMDVLSRRSRHCYVDVLVRLSWHCCVDVSSRRMFVLRAVIRKQSYSVKEAILFSSLAFRFLLPGCP